MTATHHCETCGKKTTHRVGHVRHEGQDIPVIRCVVCAATHEIQIYACRTCKDTRMVPNRAPLRDMVPCPDCKEPT